MNPIELQSYTIRDNGALIPQGPGQNKTQVTHWQLGLDNVTRLTLIAPHTLNVAYTDGSEDVVCCEGMGRRVAAAQQGQQGGKR